MTAIDCDIAIIGGGLGGVAALASLPGVDAILTEETAWLGGQISSQGVSALDEHPHIESFGCTAGYRRLREDIRAHYRTNHDAPTVMESSVLGPGLPLNPGNGWVSRLCFDPRVGRDALENQLPPDRRVFVNHVPVSAQMAGDTIQSVTLRDTQTGDTLTVHARIYIDATELGDLLPLTDTPFVTGAESHADTGEPHAPSIARPDEIQSFTMCFAVEFCPDEDHTIPAPEGYAHFRDNQPYTLSPIGRDGNPVIYRFFEVSEQGNGAFWTYRRIHDGDLLGGNDIALINWVSNDYYGASILTERERAIDEAKRLSLGFLHWLQTECPRDDGGRGYPELKLRPDIMDTADGLAMFPYIREGRRIVPLKRIVEQDISAAFNPDARARNQVDSVGLGWYSIDLHPCVGNPQASMYAPTKPFQVPLGALIPVKTRNLIAANKQIGTTHLTNGAYRLHPIEWAIGEAAGTLARYCIEHALTPVEVYHDSLHLWRYQYRLVQRGAPLVWLAETNLPEIIQLVLVRGVIKAGSERARSLHIQPDAPLGDDFDLDALRYSMAEIGVRGRVSPEMTLHEYLTMIEKPLTEALHG